MQCEVLRQKFAFLGSVWLDATDSAREGTYRWMATNERLSYTNWRPGEPSASGNPGEDCVVMYSSDGEWNDVGCGSRRSSACEMDCE